MPSTPSGHIEQLLSGLQPCTGCQAGYHTYSVTVNRTNISSESTTWYLDGRAYFTVSENQVGTAAWEAAVDHGFFLILDVAMGGGFPDAVCGCTTPIQQPGSQVRREPHRRPTAWYTAAPSPRAQSNTPLGRTFGGCIGTLVCGDAVACLVKSCQTTSPEGSAMTLATYQVTGMTCEHCVHAVTEELTSLGGSPARPLIWSLAGSRR